MNDYKTVLLPVRVPVGKYCFGKDSNEAEPRLCYHFTNTGGQPHCNLFEQISYMSLKKDSKGDVLKSHECLSLKEKKGV